MDWRGEFYRHDSKLALDAEEKLLKSDERLDRWRVEFTGMHEHRVPAVLTRPRVAPPPPVVLILHGVTGSKDAPYVRAMSRMLLEGGFATLAIDSPYHGDRAREDRDPRFHNFTSYTNRNAAVQSALGCMRAADYVSAREDLDGARLGFVGFSQGAILGTAFFVLALTLALLNRGASQQNRSILDSPPPVSAPAAPALPAVPTN